jgi:phosphate-selective porin OprO/OprP
LAAGGWAAAPAQDVSAPAPAPAAAPPTPVPAAAPQKTSDICCSDGGDDEPQTKRHPIPLEASWDYGFRIHSQDDDFRLHVGGIVQVDTVWLIGPQSVFALPGGGTNGVGNAEATQLRRTILEMDGTIFGFFDFMVEYDFANASNDNSGLQPPSFGNLTSSPAPLNIWMQARELPYLGNVRVGNQVKTIGLENNTSAPFLPFMERSDNMDAFYGPFDNGYSLGIAANNWTESERITWRYGVFQPATNVFGVALNKYVVGARVTALPWYEGDGDRLIHLGLGYEGGELVQDELRDRARPLLRNAPGFAVPVFVDTGEVPGSKQYTIAPEFALQYGPLLVEAEYAAQLFTDAIASDGQNQGTVFYHGGYVEALYFLTGEHQDYVRRAGAFGRVVPRNDLKWKKDDGFSGCGAWQVGVRFSYLDLDDKAIQGGKVYDWTAGLNWYLNPNMKVQLNYVVEHRDTPGVTPGWINGVGLRAAYDF